MKKLRLIIADDHSMVRQGVKVMIASQSSWELCGEADNGLAAIELVVHHHRVGPVAAHLEDGRRGGAAGGRDHVASPALQHHGDRLADGGFVVDHEDGAAAQVVGDGALLDDRFGHRCRQRNVDGKGRAAAWLRPHGDASNRTERLVHAWNMQASIGSAPFARSGASRSLLAAIAEMAALAGC